MATATVDPNEAALGIRSYLSSGLGFLAASKARFSDFLVHEVSVSGEVAHLTDLTGAILTPDAAANNDSNEKGNSVPSIAASDGANADTVDLTSGTKRKREESQETQQDSRQQQQHDGEPTSEKVPETVAVGDEVRKKLGDLLQRTSTLCSGAEPRNPGHAEEQVERILQFCMSQTGNSEQKYFQIPLLSSASKDDRKQWHDLFRSLPLSKFILTDTHKEQDPQDKGKISSSCDLYFLRLWHREFEKDMPNFGKFDRNNNNSNKMRKGDNTVKASRNMPYLRFVLYKENMDTAAAIQQLQRRCGGGGRGGGRGRGRGGRHNFNNRLRIGFAGMKDKRGVTCQFITVPSSTSISALVELNKPHPSAHGQQGGGHSQTGGVSILRVGNFSFVKDELRLGRLLGNRFDVVLRHVRQDEGKQEGGKSDDTANKKELLKASIRKSVGDLREFGFINYFGMQRFGKYHDTHLVGIAALRGDFERAIDIIMQPKSVGSERENCHNARLEWTKRFSNVGMNKEDKAKAEQAVAKKFVDEHGRFLNSEKSICHSLVQYPLDYQRAYSSITKTMRMMFVHAFQSLLWNNMASHRVEKLMQGGHRGVIPGDLILLDDHGIDETYDDTQNVGQLPEVHVATADDVAQGKYNLQDVVLPLVGNKTTLPSYGKEILDGLLSEHGLSMESIQNYSDRNFSYGGGYRKLVCRPKDVDFDLLEYADPLEPLVQTDLMKLSGIPIRCLDSSETDSSKNALLGMRIGFTLPSAAYATIALRELMKKPTSSEFQSGLKLERTNEEPEEADQAVDILAGSE
ncbi:hypothetical protein ACA910_002410 [Epithemia clementina (nom. ined.)]